MVYFEDGTRLVDYVIAVKEENLPLIRDYVKNLEDLGLQFEINDGTEIPLKFVKIHAPKVALDHFSLVYDVGNEDQKAGFYERERFQTFKFMRTPLSEVPPPRTGEFGNSQRIAVVKEILEDTKYGNGLHEIGLTKLILLKIVASAYPLHDGTLDEEDETMNDRKLLLTYFASFNMWYKEMPLDKINDYFGHEVAFYFAWVEFFNLMLIFPAILGIVFTLVTLITLSGHHATISEICKVDGVHVCPAVIIEKNRKLKTLSSYCGLAKIQYVFDNYFSILFAIVMSFWATVFLNYWRRKENKLKIKWGVDYDLQETQIRPEYLVKIAQQKKGKTPFSRKAIPVLRMAFSFFICFLLVMVVIIAVVIVIILKITFIKFFNKHEHRGVKNNSKLLTMCLGSTIQVIFIKLFAKVYGKVSLWLTNIENPRTQSGYDNSVLYKRFLLAFVNNYVPLFYIAFLKGRFYTIPGQFKTRLEILERDICDPVSCIPPLCIGLAFIMLFKKLTGNVLTYLAPHIKICCKLLCCKKVQFTKKKLPQWEEEFRMLPTNRFLLTTEFTEMAIQYGFVTFFVAALPLAPLFCLLNNFMEARLDAYKLVTRFRRPVPMKKSGVGAWNGVLLGLTFLSITTNGFVIAFTSDVVPREMYRFAHKGSLSGFINSTLSQFATADLVRTNVDVCYYKAKRYPPGDKMAYQLTDAYWEEMAWRLIVVFIFEHIIFICTAVLDYAIPDVPPSVKLQVTKDRSLAKEQKLKAMADNTKKDSKLGDLGARLKSIIGYKLPPDTSATRRRRQKLEDLPAAAPIGGFL